MKRQLACVLFSLGAVMFVAGGCGNKKDDGLHGTSTRHAKAKPRHADQMHQYADSTPAYTEYGEPMRLEGSEPVPVGRVLANPAAWEGRYVRVVGNVNKVCTKKGCWLEMADKSSGKPLFVKFTCPVEGRLIPMHAMGKPVVVEGTVMVKEISEADARHLKEESGATWAEVNQIRGPQKQVTLQAPAARVAGL